MEDCKEISHVNGTAILLRHFHNKERLLEKFTTLNSQNEDKLSQGVCRVGRSFSSCPYRFGPRKLGFDDLTRSWIATEVPELWILDPSVGNVLMKNTYEFDLKWDGTGPRPPPFPDSLPFENCNHPNSFRRSPDDDRETLANRFSSLDVLHSLICWQRLIVERASSSGRIVRRKRHVATHPLKSSTPAVIS